MDPTMSVVTVKAAKDGMYTTKFRQKGNETTTKKFMVREKTMKIEPISISSESTTHTNPINDASKADGENDNHSDSAVDSDPDSLQ